MFLEKVTPHISFIAQQFDVVRVDAEHYSRDGTGQDFLDPT